MHTQIYMYTQPHMQEGFFPLISASQEGHDRIVEKLLQAGATVDLQNKVVVIICRLSLVTCHVQYSLYTKYHTTFMEMGRSENISNT